MKKKSNQNEEEEIVYPKIGDPGGEFEEEE